MKASPRMNRFNQIPILDNRKQRFFERTKQYQVDKTI